MEIIRGKLPGAKKVVVYGPEGIGKSTFAAQFPEPLFIDTEGSTKDMDVARTPAPSSWTMLMEQVIYIKEHPELCQTLVIDTADWAEDLCSTYICSKSQKSGIEDFGYGKGYTYLQEEFGRLLNRLEEVIKKGIHVVLTAHAQTRKFEQPDELGAYDRWELKMTRQVAPMIKEWADMVLFANYKTFSVAVDDKGKKHKAQGGKRVMYTQHHPCWDAKNRYGLPDEVPFDYNEISFIMKSKTILPDLTKEESKTVLPDYMHIETMPTSDPKPEKKKETPSIEQIKISTKIPEALRDLMIENQVDEWDIQAAVAARGYYPSDTPIENYEPDFVAGVLVGAWPKVFKMIQDLRNKDEIPFN